MKIIKIGDDILRQKSVPIEDPSSKETSDLINNLFEIMIKEEGVGLAAPQIGVLKRVFVVDDPNSGEKLFFMNPMLIETSEEQIEVEEGCLSIPGVFDFVKRAKDVTVQSINKEGKPIITRASGWLARIILHELDHLNGILFVDKVVKKK